MYRFLVSLLSFMLLGSRMIYAQNNSFESPDGTLKVEFTTGSQLSEPLMYNLFSRETQLIQNGKIRLVLPDQTLQLKRIKRNKRRSNWTNEFGELRSVPDNYNELTLVFNSPDKKALNFCVLLRLYNEGFAYRYILEQDNEIILADERSAFGLNNDLSAWVSSHAQGVISEKKIKELKDVVERPLTVRVHDSLYLALGEAALVNYTRMKFTFDSENGLVTKLEGQTSLTGQLKSPWRYVLIGNSPGQLLERNYLVLNLNEPSPLKDLSWIKPGKVLRETSLTTAGAYRTIDFASQHAIRYILFDAGWYGKEDDERSDATRVSLDPQRAKGELNLQQVIEYGNKKGVGVILYVNRRALERQLDTLLPLYQSWGVKGIKFGFVQVGSQKWTNWLHESIRKCAQYKMLVDVHDEYRPTGYSRTYPNLLTQEGIRGDEESPKTEHSILTIFTRMIAGAGDNTNCYFTERVDKMGSHTAQMAKALCIYSPLNFLYWYDSPPATPNTAKKDAVLQEMPELKWYDQLPDTWDETRVLESDMSAYATIARRKGSDWFIGSLNGVTPRQMEWKLGFLKPGKKYHATIYTHDPAINSPTHVQIERRTLTSEDLLHFSIEARDGITVHFKED